MGLHTFLSAGGKEWPPKVLGNAPPCCRHRGPPELQQRARVSRRQPDRVQTSSAMRSIAGLSCCLAATAAAAGRIPAFAWSGSRWVFFAGLAAFDVHPAYSFPPRSYLSANYGYVHEEVPAATLVDVEAVKNLSTQPVSRRNSCCKQRSPSLSVRLAARRKSFLMWWCTRSQTRCGCRCVSALERICITYGHRCNADLR